MTLVECRTRQGAITLTAAGLWALSLLISVCASLAQQPDGLGLRLGKLSQLDAAQANEECGSMASLIDRSLAGERRAQALDQVRDACADKLTWTNPVLVRIAELAVERRRPLEAEAPAPLCKALRVLGLSYHYLTRVEDAEKVYMEAVAVARRWRGRGATDEDVAAGLQSLSSLQLDRRQFTAALASIGESLRLRRRAVPFLAEKVVSALGSRARVEEKLDLRRAKATLLEARRLSSGLGPEHSYDRTRIASNLGEILFRLGELPQAAALLQEAEAQRLKEHAAGRPVRQLAATQLLLGEVFVDLGDYPAAIDYYRKAVAGHKEWLGEEPYRYCDALTGLASVLEESGRWEEALDLQRQALAIREDAAPKSSDPELQLMLTRSLTHLGALQQRMGEPTAGALLERALRIQDAVLPEGASLDRAQTLLQLARHWQQAGEAPRARPLIERCLRELAAIGEQGPLLFEAQEVAAEVAADPAAGLRLLATASESARRLYGDQSPRMAGVLLSGAELHRRQGNAKMALADALAAEELSLPHVSSVVRAFPRDQALAFAADRRRGLDTALRLLAEDPAPPAATVAHVWQTAAISRMLVRDAEIDRRRLALLTKDPALTAAARSVTAARERFAYLLVQSQGSPKTRTSRLENARRHLVAAEEELAGQARSQVSSRESPPPSIEHLRRSLPAGASLVAFFQYRTSGAHAYVAFVLASSGPARVVALGDGVSIEWKIEQWRRAILGSSDAATRTRLGEALRRALWDPIAPHLGAAKIVFVVPDGALHLVPFVALPGPRGGYLIEQGWFFHTLAAERDLLAGSPPRRTGPWLVLGAVDYGRAVQPPAAATQSAALLRGDEAERGTECRRAGLPAFASLPGSRDEMQDLATIWGRLAPGRSVAPRPALAMLAGPEATEHALRLAVRGRRIVHLATHGFVSASSCDRRASATRGIGGLALDSEVGGAEAQPFSGLVLAGANDRGKALRSDEDGILTEEEILELDLGMADWVVLSACDTGLGATRPGEGVIGMLRAFQVAGARTVIVSLWSVEDRAARTWMRELYQARFEQRLSTLEAVRQAAMRSLLLYRERGDDNPVRWAGFLAIGQWS